MAAVMDKWAWAVDEWAENPKDRVAISRYLDDEQYSAARALYTNCGFALSDEELLEDLERGRIKGVCGVYDEEEGVLALEGRIEAW